MVGARWSYRYSMGGKFKYGNSKQNHFLMNDLCSSLFQLLDDSKILCLANGERIGMSGHTRILFEVDSLVNASPATVSRCAMVYLDPTDLGYMPFLNHWYRCKLPTSFPQSGIAFLRELMEFSLDKG